MSIRPGGSAAPKTPCQGPCDRIPWQHCNDCTVKVKFELYGTEILDKQVASSGNCGRVYLPLHWLGKKVKIIRLD